MVRLPFSTPKLSALREPCGAGIHMWRLLIHCWPPPKTSAWRSFHWAKRLDPLWSSMFSGRGSWMFLEEVVTSIIQLNDSIKDENQRMFLYRLWRFSVIWTSFGYVPVSKTNMWELLLRDLGRFLSYFSHKSLEGSSSSSSTRTWWVILLHFLLLQEPGGFYLFF